MGILEDRIYLGKKSQPHNVFRSIVSAISRGRCGLVVYGHIYTILRLLGVAKLLNHYNLLTNKNIII